MNKQRRDYWLFHCKLEAGDILQRHYSDFIDFQQACKQARATCFKVLPPNSTGAIRIPLHDIFRGETKFLILPKGVTLLLEA